MKTIVFDFDGTIADSFPVIIQIAHEMTHRSQLVQPEEVAKLRRLRLLDVAQELRLPRWQWPFLLVRGRHKMTRRLRDVRPFPGIDAALATLHGDGFQLFIMSSNSRRNVQRFLVQHGLGGYFQDIIGSVGLFGKARALTKIVKRHQLDPDTTLYVGDEPRDIEGAKAAGIACVAVSWGFNTSELLAEHAPMVVVRTPEQLRKYLEEWGAAA